MAILLQMTVSLCLFHYLSLFKQTNKKKNARAIFVLYVFHRLTQGDLNTLNSFFLNKKNRSNNTDSLRYEGTIGT